MLDELLADSGLDFFVLCSTRGNVVSSGAHGQVGYIAANEFLDAFASYKKARNDMYTVTINWDPGGCRHGRPRLKGAGQNWKSRPCLERAPTR